MKAGVDRNVFDNGRSSKESSEVFVLCVSRLIVKTQPDLVNDEVEVIV